MTNFESMLKEITPECMADLIRHNMLGSYDCSFIRKKILDVDACEKITCKNCKKLVINWLNTEPCIISEEEYKIIKNLPSIWKYMARNYDGTLFLYTQKPMYLQVWGHWEMQRVDNTILYREAEITDLYEEGIFDFVTINDKEPYEIEKLLKMGEEKYEDKSAIQ